MFPAIILAAASVVAGGLSNQLNSDTNKQNIINQTKSNDDKTSNNVGYSTKEIADILGISEYTVRQKIRDKQIIAEKIPGVAGYRITQESLDDYINKKKRKPHFPEALKNDKVNNIVDFSSTLGKIVNASDDSTYDIDLLKKIKEGKETDLKGLELRLQMLLLEKNDTNYFKKKKLALEIDKNNLEAEIKAYDIIINSIEKAEKNEP